MRRVPTGNFPRDKRLDWNKIGQRRKSFANLWMRLRVISERRFGDEEHQERQGNENRLRKKKRTWTNFSIERRKRAGTWKTMMAT